MDTTRHSWWKIAGGIGLAALAAGIVVCIRLVAATPPTVPPPAAPATRDHVAERTPEPAEMPQDLLLPENKAVLARWMEEHPGRMMDGIDRMEDREQAAVLAKVLVEAVGGMHYDLLLDWLARQKDPKLAALVFRSLIPRLIRENPDQCISIAFALGNGEEARLARDEFFFALPLEQRVRLMKRQSPEERAWLLSRRATGFGERAPELCVEMIRQLPASGHTREALAKLVKAWAGGANVYHLADPMSAVKGVMTIEDAEMRRHGLRVATFEWAGPDPDLAAAWVNKLPAGPDRDAAIEGMVKRFSADNPDRALEWAAAITDETLRLKVGEEAVRKKTPGKGKETEKP